MVRLESKLLWVLALATAGCSGSREHDPRFVGNWRSALPVGGGIALDTPMGRAINVGVRDLMRQDNASGAQGVDLTIRDNGTFRMHMWMPLSSIPTDPASDPRRLDRKTFNHTTDGTWYSKGELLFLNSSKFLPYAHTRKTRWYTRTGSRYTSRQEIVLSLRSTGELSQFGDGVRPDAYETALNFRRRPSAGSEE